jgi:hypothetical protein
MAREEQAATTTLGDVLKGGLQQKTDKEELPAEDASGETGEAVPPEADSVPLSAGDESPVAEKDELPAEEASGEIKETAAPDADSVHLSAGDDSPVADDAAAKDDKQE